MLKMVYQVRLENLRRLISQHGGRSAVAAKIGTTKQYMSLICPASSPPKRSIGDKIARRIEESFGLPIGYLDAQESPTPQDDHWVEVPCLSPTVALGAPGIIRADQAIDSMRLSKHFIRRQTPATSFDRLAIFTVSDDCMAPTCGLGDFVLIDTAVTAAADSGVYIIGHASQLFVKRIQRHVDGSVEIISDNPAYAPLRLESMKGITVFGRVMLALGVRKL